ncbi:MAG: NAD(P)/FAD-dependent oxidoreductase, partial [Candidatus Aminicenantes bacterium]|nr:NAD(P)/FAD-dependent oxidoreductase [Candidatus Aminicenantes bacterium]
MAEAKFMRRDFLKAALAGVPALALDWDSFPRGDQAPSPKDTWDAVVIGSGLGGLSCAAAFARQGFKALVLEQHSVPGGYATTFKRPGGFEFDVSLHSTTVGERNGVYNLIPGFPEIEDINFVPHHGLYRAIFPDYDIRVPQKDVAGYLAILTGYFPAEKEGLENLFSAMQGVVSDLNKYSAAGGKVDMATFPRDYPHLLKCVTSTWEQFQAGYIKDPKLKAIVSSLWGYFGLPPSKLASIYYAMPLISYLGEGGYYPVGKSQKISNALAKFIEDRGGKVLLKTRVEAVLLKDQAATGVRTADGQEFLGKVVVSNASAYETFHKMVGEQDFLKDYLAKMDGFSISLSCFQVFLGLKKDLVKEVGVKDSEIFFDPGYDPEAAYQSALSADVERSGFGLTLYDNLYAGYSPKGKNILNILTLQGYEPWKKYEADYFAGRKEAYRAEKERLADILIKKAEATLLPGLSRAIEVKEIGTPLT